jgi:hypothetical protein
MELEITMLSKVGQVQKMLHAFSYVCKIYQNLNTSIVLYA